ncbi:MAG: hypothetical protein WC455_09165 [Dehalococcoidia bacterium]|jgi:hypothetical protein
MKHHVIGIESSPVELVSSRELTAYKIAVTHGGGMGGAYREYYAKSIHKDGRAWGNEPMFYLVTLSPPKSTTMKINPRWIVFIEKVKLIVVVTERKTSYGQSIGDQIGVNEHYYKIGFNDTYSIKTSNNFSFAPVFRTHDGIEYQVGDQI